MKRRRVLPVFLPPQADRASRIDPAPRLPAADLEVWAEAAVERIGCLTQSGLATQFAFFGGSFGKLPARAANRVLEELGPLLGPRDSLRVTLDPPHVRDLSSLGGRGVTTIELDAASLDDAALEVSGLSWSGAEAERAAEEIRRAGLELGIVLRPGMPGGAPGEVLKSAQRVAALAPSFVRIYPVLVLAGSPLEEAWRSNRYRPLALAETVAMCRELIALFEGAGVAIGRIGLQPKVDLPGEVEVVAGPHHPCLRLLAEAELWLERATRLIESNLPGRPEVTLLVAPRDESRLRGLQGANLRRLKERFRLARLSIRAESRLAEGGLALLLRDESGVLGDLAAAPRG